MIRTGTLDRALASRSKFTLANGTGYFKSEFITSPAGEGVKSPEGDGVAPQSFLVEQDPDSVILPHFHLQDEFQVMVQGGGRIGRHPVRGLAVHYAGAHTGYGPITAGAEGLWYFTLRPGMDYGAKFLPEARSEMKKDVPKRHLLGGPVEVSGDCAGRTEAVSEEIFPPQADGIGGWIVRIPPKGSTAAPALAGGLARFYVVAAGTARIGDQGDELDRWATVFVTPEEEPVQINAGSGGAEVLVLQFPA